MEPRTVQEPADPAPLSLAQKAELNRLGLKERIGIGLALLLVMTVSLLDALEDFETAQGWRDWWADIAYIGLMLAVLAYLWRVLPCSLRRRSVLLTEAVIRQHRDLLAWRNKSRHLMHGISGLIQEQLHEWQLTIAEQQIALLLLKGLSQKEIALIRHTSEVTVRQQAAAVYHKAGLRNRSELSAFFLEDLLIPPPPSEAALDWVSAPRRES